MSSVRVTASLIARTARPGCVLPRTLLSRSTPIQVASTRLFSTSSLLTKALAASAGSGQGGKAEKEAAKKAKEQARAQKEKERARKEKEREKLKALKEKEKLKKEKERAKLQREKEKAKLSKLKEKKPKTTSVLRPPKAPTNSWGMFLGDYIAARKRELGPGGKIGSLSEVTKAAGQEYAHLDSTAKAQLQERAEEQRAAYPAILEAWKKSLTPEMIKEENTVRANRRKLGLSRKANLKAEGEPKRPKTAYFLFLSEQREKGPDSDVLQGETRILEQSKLVAAAWRALSDSDKKHYNDLYEQERRRYEEAKAEFDAKHTSSATA